MSDEHRWIAILRTHRRLRRLYRKSVAWYCDRLLWFMAEVLPFRLAQRLRRYEQAAVRHYDRLFGKNAPFEYDEEQERFEQEC